MMGQPPMGYGAQSFAGQPPMDYDAKSFAGQPPMGYDAQSFAFQSAEAELAALEEAKKAKEEKEKQREVDRLAHKLRSGERDHKDNQACARQLCMWAIFNGLMFGLALTGDSWITASWWSQSISELRVTLGLFNIEVNLQCNPSALDPKLCNMMKPYANHDNGWWTTVEMREAMCAHSDATQSGCAAAKWVYISGWPPLICFPLAAGFECLSLLILYWYWHGKPSSTTRVLSAKCAALAAFFGCLGFVGYFACGPWLTSLPRKWCDMAGQKEAAMGAFTGFRNTWRQPFGWAAVCAMFALAGTFLRMTFQYNLPFHIDEPDPYGFDENTNLSAEAKKEAERMWLENNGGGSYGGTADRAA